MRALRGAASAAFALREAERRRHGRALSALRAIGEPPHADTKRFMTRVRWVAAFGGVHSGQTFWGMLRATLAELWASPHYGFREMLGALRAMAATPEQLLPNLSGLELMARELRLAVPVAIFQGRLDAVAPPQLARAFAERLALPLIEFEHSAHRPYDEEPERFRAELLRFIPEVGGRELGTRSHTVAA